MNCDPLSVSAFLKHGAGGGVTVSRAPPATDTLKFAHSPPPPSSRETGRCIMTTDDTRTRLVPKLRSEEGVIWVPVGTICGDEDRGLVTDASGVQRSPEWLNSRLDFFGASTTSSALLVFARPSEFARGLPDDFVTTLMAKGARVQGEGSLAGPPPPKVFPRKVPGVAMAKGVALEDCVAAKVEQATGIVTIPGGVYIMRSAPYIRVSLDRITGHGLPVELKCQLRPPTRPDDPPPFYYVLQTLLQAMAVGAPGGLLAMAYLDAPEFEAAAEKEAPHPLEASVADVGHMCALWRSMCDAGTVTAPGLDPRDPRGPYDTLALYSVTRSLDSDLVLGGIYAEAHALVQRIAACPRDTPMTYEDVEAAWKGVLGTHSFVARAKEVALAATTRGLSSTLQKLAFPRPSLVKLTRVDVVTGERRDMTLAEAIGDSAPK